jgi:hypothetical protein
MAVPIRLASAAALLAAPALAMGQVYVPPSSGTSTQPGGALSWTTVDLALCSLGSGSASTSPGGIVFCPPGSVPAPQTAATAFGNVWAIGAASNSYSSTGASLTWLNPTTSAVAGSATVSGISSPVAARAAGTYLWIAGSSGLGNGKSNTVAVGVDATGTVRAKFASKIRQNTANATALGYGAGSLWVADNTGHIYAVNPANGKLLRTITTSNTSGLAVTGSQLWATSPRGYSVRVFDTSTGAQRAVISVKGSPNAAIAASGSVFVFTQAYLYRFSPKTLKQTGRYSYITAPESGWLGAVGGPGGIWASNFVAQVVRFNTSTMQFDVNSQWSNNDTAGPLASAGGAVWVPDTNSSPFPVGHAITRFAVTPPLS